MERKRKFMAFLLVMLMLFTVRETAAYFLTKIESDNYIEFGSVDLNLVQTMLDENGQEVSFDTSIPFDVTHAARQSRILRVVNTGNHALYIRVQFRLEGQDQKGTKFQAGEYVSCAMNSEDWTYADGWYYYNHITNPGETTTELMDQIIFDMDPLLTAYPGSSFRFYFYAQGVQSEHQEANNVLQVVGWPEE